MYCPFGHLEHDPCPAEAANQPAVQFVQLVDPFPFKVDADPAGHVRHAVEFADGAYSPGGHAVHDDCPADAENRPAGQTVHADCADALANEPAGQSTHDDCPRADENEPSGQARHAGIELALAKKPLAQGVHAVLFWGGEATGTGENVPSTQGSHDVTPSLFEKVPAGHRVHDPVTELGHEAASEVHERLPACCFKCRNHKYRLQREA